MSNFRCYPDIARRAKRPIRSARLGSTRNGAGRFSGRSTSEPFGTVLRRDAVGGRLRRTVAAVVTAAGYRCRAEPSAAPYHDRVRPSKSLDTTRPRKLARAPHTLHETRAHRCGRALYQRPLSSESLTGSAESLTGSAVLGRAGRSVAAEELLRKARALIAAKTCDASGVA